MTSFWPHWQRPLFLVALPIIIWLLWKLWHFHQIKGSWQKLIPTSFQPWLLSGNAGKESFTYKIILSLASLIAFLALLGPSWQHLEQPPLKIDSPLVIVLDLTPNMLANDIPPSRLQSAKRKVIDIINARKDAQTAVIVYSGSAHVLVPLSDDQATIANLLDYISPNIMPAVGQRADLAIAKAIKLLTNTQQASNGQILLVTSGLSTSEQTAIKQSLTNHLLTLSILGVGTSQGAPIASPTGGFVKDAHGQIILPKLDTATLKKFANSLGGHYSNITLNNEDIKDLDLTNVKGSERHLAETDNRIADYWQDQGYWLLFPLLLLASLAARKGWLLCLPFVLFAFPPQPAEAFEWNQLWLNKDQQGQQLLQHNQPAEAAKRFTNKQWQGYSSYEAKDYLEAEKHFANETSAEGIYNYGNSLARQGKYKEAIAEWDKAIKAKPNFNQAIKNKQLVEELLKKQQEKQQQGQQQKQNNQSQNDQARDNAQQNQQQQSQSKADEQSQTAQQQQNASSEAKENKQGQQSQQTSDQSTHSTSPDNDESKPATLSTVPKSQPQPDKPQTQENSANQNQIKEQHNSAQHTNSATENLEQEQSDSLQQWMRTIPDDPSELLRRKFYYEQRYKGDN